VALQSRDRYCRLLGSIWRDRVLVQEHLVREGLCVPYVVPPNIEHAERIRVAAEQARRAAVGIYEPAQPLLESPREHRQRRSAPVRPEQPALAATARSSSQWGSRVGAITSGVGVDRRRRRSLDELIGPQQ
jgi:hypothetical protein